MSQRGLGFKPFSHRVVQRLARGQRMGPGAYMFVVHRITAILITFYLFLHLIWLGSVLSGPDGFNDVMKLTANPFVRILELGLVWVVLFHMLNGVRLIVVNLAPEINQKILAFTVTGASFGIALVSIPFLLR